MMFVYDVLIKVSLISEILIYLLSNLQPIWLTRWSSGRRWGDTSLRWWKRRSWPLNFDLPTWCWSSGRPSKETRWVLQAILQWSWTILHHRTTRRRLKINPFDQLTTSFCRFIVGYHRLWCNWRPTGNSKAPIISNNTLHLGGVDVTDVSRDDSPVVNVALTDVYWFKFVTRWYARWSAFLNKYSPNANITIWHNNII